MSAYGQVAKVPSPVTVLQHSSPATLHVTGYSIQISQRLASAIDAVQTKEISVRRAASQYGVAKSTLHDYVSGKIKHGNRGPERYLSEEEEKMLVFFIEQSASIGYPKKPQEVEYEVL